MKVIFVLFRRSDISREQCHAQWSGEPHISVVRKLPGLTRWVQNRVTAPPDGNVPDGIGELWFDGSGALEAPEMAAAVEDAKRFLDMTRSCALVVEERPILG